MQLNKRFRWGLLVTTLVGVAACTSNDVDPNAGDGEAPGKGSADFTKYVAVGNSLTAGYADGGVYREGQLNSYPNILAGQFKTVGGGDFVQPLFSQEQANGSSYIRLRGLPANASSLPRLDTAKTQLGVRGVTSTGRPLYTKFTDANQNLGIPGIKMADILTAGYGSQAGNPFFERLVPDATPTTTYFQYVSNNLNGATFFSSWLGNNDALGYATSGGTSALTPTDVFTTNYTAIMNKLTEGGRKGVVIGIPNILGAPYFTTVTAQVTAQVQALGLQGLAIRSKTAQGTVGVRISGAGDYFLLSIAPVLNSFIARGVGLSAANPIPDEYVLDAAEVAALSARVTEYNTALKAQADAKGVAYVDINPVLQQASQAGGFTQNGVTFTAEFIRGGLFSLDGIHLTPAGYALVANEIIKGINAKYGSTIPQVNSANYRRVLLQ